VSGTRFSWHVTCKAPPKDILRAVPQRPTPFRCDNIARPSAHPETSIIPERCDRELKGAIESLQCRWLALRGPALQGQFAGRYSKVLQNSNHWTDRAVWFSPLDSLPESAGLPWQRDQNQREANAESFLIDTGIGEASTWSVVQDL
jgi:hypothetical protein